MNTPLLAAPKSFLDSAFPFHFAFDERLRLTGVGKSLRKVVPGWREGASLQDEVAVERPDIDFATSRFVEYQDRLMVLNLKRSGLRLRGQLVPVADDAWAFLGTPWQVTIESLQGWGLTISDFALHDSLVDNLFIQQMQSTQLSDLQRMIEQLERVAADKSRLAQAEKALEHDLSAAGDMRIRFTQGGIVLDARAARPEYLPVHVSELVGKSLAESIPCLGTAIEQGKSWFASNDQPFRFEYETQSHGKPYFFDGRLIGTLNGDFLLLARDVTERRLFAQRLQHQSQHDPLTGLPNRGLFNQKMRQALEVDRLFALMFVDVNDFKDINDTLGHTAGDEVLQVVAARIHRELSPRDTAARLGGDEFGVLITSINGAEDAEQMAKRLVARVAQPITTKGGQDVRIAISIGVAISDCGNNASELYRNADLAMYEAKGRSESAHICFDPSLYEGFVKKAKLRDELVLGLARKEFIPFYQPIIEFASGEVVGWEALARWNHPTDGIRPPSMFVSLAEESNLVLDLGRQILECACAQANELAQITGLPQHMHVNLSPIQIQQNDMVETIDRILTQSGIPGEWLTLEITETSLFGDLHHAETVINAIRELGVRIALDDFGVGYSSLSYLDRFQIDVLKLDRSFVSQVSDPHCRGYRLIEPIIQLGRALNLEIVAEGIETIEQSEKMQEFGCHFAQGYLYGHPMPLESIPEFLRKHNSEKRVAR